VETNIFDINLYVKENVGVDFTACYGKLMQ